MKKTVHLTLQGKGGCFKSGITALVAQYLASHGAQPLQCLDTDPVNRTFSRLTALQVQGVELLDKHQKIDSRAFDELIGRILDHNGDTVIDTGASVFVPLKAYLTETGALGLLQDEGVRILIHVPLIGGLDFVETANGLTALLDDLPEAEFVAWCNPYFGDVSHDGRTLEQSALYAKWQERFAGIVNMLPVDPATFGQDISDMRSDGLTYQQAINHPGYKPMVRHRLKRIWLHYCQLLASLPLTGGRHAAA